MATQPTATPAPANAAGPAPDTFVWFDGQLVPGAEASISVMDHGVLYGDGVFEGIRVYQGNVFRLKEHIERLYESAKTISLEIPMTRDEMMQATADTVAANDALLRDGLPDGVSLVRPEGTYLAWLDCRALALDGPCTLTSTLDPRLKTSGVTGWEA